MISLKKIEIVVNTLHKEKLVSLFRQNGIDKYTLIDEVKGKGNRGWQDGDGLTDSFKNSYFLVACTVEEMEKLKEPLRIFLKKCGGICLISEAEWLKH
jgi:hypothetical protein